jgi:hypothetical protein
MVLPPQYLSAAGFYSGVWEDKKINEIRSTGSIGNAFINAQLVVMSCQDLSSP